LPSAKRKAFRRCDTRSLSLSGGSSDRSLRPPVPEPVEEQRPTTEAQRQKSFLHPLRPLRTLRFTFFYYILPSSTWRFS
jgi:hypothetical protein